MFQVPRKKGKRQMFFAGIFLILVIIVTGIVFGVRAVTSHVGDLPPKHERRAEKKEQQKQELVEQNLVPKFGTILEGQAYIQFTGEEFKNFYDTHQYQHVALLRESPEITGNTEADMYIQNLAESRGYKLRSEASTERLSDVFGQTLQPEAKDAYVAMQKAAFAEGEHDFRLVSGYRSVERQQQIFANSISDLSGADIISGNADATLNSILDSRSIPGYSKHHTGYTVDIGCGNYHLDASVADSGCFAWLSENNYHNAKRFGFIPSYPEGASKQGPDPEPWEYVWVGEDVLLAAPYQNNE
jgi:LAS superfamily LD-carboxypeptidase LdcB